MEHLHEENTKLSDNASALHASIFLWTSGFFCGFYREEGKGDGTIIKWDRDVDVLVLLNSDHRKQQCRDGMKSNIHEE